MSPVVPEAACVEGYDSDTGCVQPGTRVTAARRQTTSHGSRANPPKTLSRYNFSREGKGSSDPGRSLRDDVSPTDRASTRPQVMASDESMPPPPRPSTTQPTSRPRPIVHTGASYSSRSRPPSSRSRAAEPCRDRYCRDANCATAGVCNDPDCRDQNCVGARYAAQRRSGDYTNAAQYTAGYGTSPVQYSQRSGYSYPYAQPSQPSQTQRLPQARPRTLSSARQARPATFAGYSQGMPYGGGQVTPSSSNSAYTQEQVAAWQAYWAQVDQYEAYRNGVYGSQPSSNPLYTTTPATATSPTSPTNPTTTGNRATFSTRMANTTPAYSMADVKYTARGPTGRVSRMPGEYPRADGSTETEEETSSESELEREEYERNRRGARDSRLMSSSSRRRPSINKHYTSSPAVPTQSSRDQTLRRNPVSDGMLDYISGSDNVDSDQTVRATLGRSHTNYSSSTRSSRRPSLATTATGSSNTRSTNISSIESGMANVTINSKNGRDISYLSKVEQQRILDQRRYEDEMRRQQREAEEYQKGIRGANQPPELTAENIGRYTPQVKRTGSLKSGHSRKTSRSATSKSMATGVEVRSGDTTVYLPMNTKFEVQQDDEGRSRIVIEEGRPTAVVETSGKSKDSAYMSSSKSSSSRVGRSRGRSEASGSAGKRREHVREGSRMRKDSKGES